MNTRSPLLSLVFSLGLAVAAAQAETTVKLTNVHLCCNSCVKGVDKAIAGVGGVTAACDRPSETVTLTAPDKAAAQKAVDALVAAGYYGRSGDAEVKVKDTSMAKNAKTTSLTVADVHLCCDKCVKAVDKAVTSVKGVTGHTAEKNAKTFEVKGDFNQKEVFSALQSAGLTGKAAK